MPKISAGTIAEHKRAVSDRLFQAWAELIAERGYDATSLADVAERAGIGRTAIYNYFSDKETLLIAHTERQLAIFLAKLDTALADVETPPEALEVFVHQHVLDFATRPLLPGPELATLVGTQVYAELAAHTEPLHAVLRGIITDGVASGDFDVTDIEASATMAIACIGAERVPVGLGEHTSEEADERILTFLTKALGAPGREGAQRRRVPAASRS